jgi:hypothetical protein
VRPLGETRRFDERFESFDETRGLQTEAWATHPRVPRPTRRSSATTTVAVAGLGKEDTAVHHHAVLAVRRFERAVEGADHAAQDLRIARHLPGTVHTGDRLRIVDPRPMSSSTTHVHRHDEHLA